MDSAINGLARTIVEGLPECWGDQVVEGQITINLTVNADIMDELIEEVQRLDAAKDIIAKARKVYKYTLKKTTEQDVIMPAGAVVLSVTEQWGEAVLYALVDPDEQQLKPRRIFIHGTGHEVHVENLRFIGTARFLSGQLMLHVFEKVVE